MNKNKKYQENQDYQDYQENQGEIKKLIFCSLFAALMSIGSYLSLPIGPVAITLQTLFVYLSGLVLGRGWATASVLIYILAGILGFPVFAGGKGGLGHAIGPTGGYLIGFIPAVYLIGFVSKEVKINSAWKYYFVNFCGLTCGTLITYSFGILWLKFITNKPFIDLVLIGIFPFLISDFVKIITALIIFRIVKPLIKL